LGWCGGALLTEGEESAKMHPGLGEANMAGDAGGSVRASCHGAIVPWRGGGRGQFVGVVCLEALGS
jgi:hypothetical protein